MTQFINYEVCQTEGRVLTNDGGPETNMIHPGDDRTDAQRKLDASVTPEDARKYIRKERERNANRDKPRAVSDDAFINDYD